MRRALLLTLSALAMSSSGCLDAGHAEEPGGATGLQIVVAPTVSGEGYVVTDVTYAVELVDVGANVVWSERREVPGRDDAPAVATFEVPPEALQGPPGDGPAIRYVRLVVDRFLPNIGSLDGANSNPADEGHPLVQRVACPPGELTRVDVPLDFALRDYTTLGQDPAEYVSCVVMGDCSDERVWIEVGCHGSYARDPHLYLDPLVIDCGDRGRSVVPLGGPWGTSHGPAPPFVRDSVERWGPLEPGWPSNPFTWAVTADLDLDALPDDADCVVRLRNAAAPRALVGDVLVPDATWSATPVEVPLTKVGDHVTCGPYGIGALPDDAPQAPFATELP